MNNRTLNSLIEELLLIIMFFACLFSFGEISGLTITGLTYHFSPYGIILRMFFLLLSVIGLMGVLTNSRINISIFMIICFIDLLLQGLTVETVPYKLILPTIFSQILSFLTIIFGMITISNIQPIQMEEDQKQSAKSLAVEIKDLSKIYEIPGSSIIVPALKNINMTINKGDFVAIMGPSGSGKSTLLNVIGALDKASDGMIKIDGVDIASLDDRGLAFLRNKKIGFVFQSYNLISRSTVVQNVEIPSLVIKMDERERRKRATELLMKVGLGEYLHRKPRLLSGGEQQRVAIARALYNQPTILLCDEPTGNLDSKSGEKVMEIIKELNEDLNVTVIVVTHDPQVGQATDRIFYLKDGIIEGIKENIKM